MTVYGSRIKKPYDEQELQETEVWESEEEQKWELEEKDEWGFEDN